MVQNQRQKYTQIQSTKTVSENRTLYDEFGNFFDKDELKQLRSIPAGKSKDSTFILTCMRFLYRDLSVLNNRSVTGRAFKKQKKTPLSPWKSTLIKKMLNQRLESENGLDEVVILERMRNVVRLMKNAIGKLQPKNLLVDLIQTHDESSQLQSSQASKIPSELEKQNNMNHQSPQQPIYLSKLNTANGESTTYQSMHANSSTFHFQPLPTQIERPNFEFTDKYNYQSMQHSRIPPEFNHQYNHLNYNQRQPFQMNPSSLYFSPPLIDQFDSYYSNQLQQTEYSYRFDASNSAQTYTNEDVDEKPPDFTIQ